MKIRNKARRLHFRRAICFNLDQPAAMTTAPGSKRSDSHESTGAGWFATTHWSVVLAAASDLSPTAQAALERLCRTYWPPVHAYVRRWGFSPEDAEDLTQQFFARFLEKKHYRLADRDRGRFRTFLLTAVKHFLVNENERASAQKRGGGKPVMSLDEPASERSGPSIEPVDERTADRIFEQSWAMTLLAQVRTRLETEYAAEGKADRFTQLEKFLPGEENDLTYSETAARLGIPEGTLKSDVHRLKRHYRELLREEIAHTVSKPTEVDEEIRYLITVLGRGRG